MARGRNLPRGHTSNLGSRGPQRGEDGERSSTDEGPEGKKLLSSVSQQHGVLPVVSRRKSLWVAVGLRYQRLSDVARR